MSKFFKSHHNRKRTQEEYEREIEEAAKRMKKRPEALGAARSSREWKDFLDDIGITNSNAPFWGNVRDEIGFTPKRLAEQNIEIETSHLFRDTKGRFIKTPMDKLIILYRHKETGRFVSRKRLAEQNIEIETSHLFRDTKGRFTKTPMDKPIILYRHKETGRFVSRKKIEK